MRPVLMHGFALKENDFILYVHPKDGMMKLEIKDIWPTYRYGKARWLDLWSIPQDGQPARPVATLLAQNFISYQAYLGRQRNRLIAA